MNGRGLAAILIVALALSGCVGFNLVEGGKRVELGQGIAVQPDRSWNRITFEGAYEYWTLDGLGLQNILFIKGVEDGEALIPRSHKARGGGNDEAFPTFRKGMSFLEIRELFEATLSREKAQRLSVTRFAPTKFGNKDGFRFDFAYDSEDGLQMLGSASGTIFEDRLYMLVYRGTKLHFYDRGHKGFDKILTSLRFI